MECLQIIELPNLLFKRNMFTNGEPKLEPNSFLLAIVFVLLSAFDKFKP